MMKFTSIIHHLFIHRRVYSVSSVYSVYSVSSVSSVSSLYLSIYV